MNIYVGNLPFTVSEDDIRKAFEAYGSVTSVSLIKDRETGRMRGFGFVEMPNEQEAQAAIQAMNGQDFMRRTLVVNPARPREDRGGERRPGRFSNSSRGGDREQPARRGGFTSKRDDDDY